MPHKQTFLEKFLISGSSYFGTEINVTRQKVRQSSVGLQPLKSPPGPKFHSFLKCKTCKCKYTPGASFSNLLFFHLEGLLISIISRFLCSENPKNAETEKPILYSSTVILHISPEISAVQCY